MLDSLLNITFIQLSTRYDYFSLAPFSLISFWLYFSADFPLVFLCINLFPFLQFCHIYSCLDPFVFHLFYNNIFFFHGILITDVNSNALMFLLVYVFLSNLPISFIFVPNFSKLATTNVFQPTLLWIGFFYELYNSLFRLTVFCCKKKILL